MQLRNMTADDCAAVAALEKENFTMPWSKEAFLVALTWNYEYLVAEEQGKILGYCGMSCVLDEGEIPKLCVAKSARRRGFARAMLEAMEQTARQRGIRTLFLEVRQSNQAARQLYRLVGFEEIGTRKGFYEQPREDAILMRKTL